MRRVGVFIAGVLCAIGLSPVVPAAHAASACGALDLPETGIRGEVPKADQNSGRAERGYNCGIALVGYDNLGGRGGNANMAWSGNCAYISGDGVAVVDVRDPVHPHLVQTLHGYGSNKTVETINAADVGARHLLVAGKYGIGGIDGEPKKGPVDIYDTTDCAHPRRLATFMFPANVHNLTISADGNRLFSTLPLQAADITDPAHPRYIASLDKQLRAQGVVHFEYAHEAWTSPDGNRLYIGGQQAYDQDLYVVDIHNWPQRKLSVLGKAYLPGHSIRPMTINGKPYLLNSDESVVGPTAVGCVPQAATPFGGVASPYITDISNEHQPHAVSQFHLPINQPANCKRMVTDGMDASVHYHDVDDPTHTTFALLSMWNAGLRIVDVRDPLHPTDVAYFNPGVVAGQLDQAWAHVRYQPSTGIIWFSTATGGFWVLELEPQMRAQLGLPAKPAYHPTGAAPRPAATRAAVKVNAADATAMYCTLGPVWATA